MRLLVTGGGTAGHVYPALVVVRELLSDEKWGTRRDEVAWVGSGGSIEERILAREDFAFYPISSGALRGRGPLAGLRSLGRLVRGYGQSRRLVRGFRPDAVLATGGYVCVPVVLAARAGGCPSLVYLPDMEPGFAVKFVSLFVSRVALSFDSVARHFPARKVVVTGYPVRRVLHSADKARARSALGLEDGSPVLLVMGGSRGAHSLNEAVRSGLETLVRWSQVVHLSGFDDYEEMNATRDRLPGVLRPRYHLFAYMHEQMTDALAAADLVVARAGAATLGEFPAVGLPAVLVPYPYAGQHQYVNANYLAQHGAAVIVEDAELSGRLLATVEGLLGDPERIRRMAQAARSLAVPDAARRVARELVSLASGRVRGE